MNEQIEKQNRKNLMNDMLVSGWSLRDVIDVNKSNPYEMIELGLCELQKLETHTSMTDMGKETNLVIYEADDMFETGVYRLIVKGSSDIVHYFSDCGKVREVKKNEDIFNLLFTIERDMTIKSILGI